MGGAVSRVIEVEVQPLVRTRSMISKTFLSMFEDAPPEADTLRFAMKLQPKVQRNAENQACSELVALRRAAHPFIVRLEQAFQTPKFYALLLELCPGGNLNSLICRSFDEGGRCKGLPVYRTALFMGQALLALLHLHSKLGCVYRDMKPDNVLIADDNTAKLADFGLATKVGGRRHMSVVGTLGFLAPELVFGDREPDDESETDGTGGRWSRLARGRRQGVVVAARWERGRGSPNVTSRLCRTVFPAARRFVSHTSPDPTQAETTVSSVG